MRSSSGTFPTHRGGEHLPPGQQQPRPYRDPNYEIKAKPRENKKPPPQRAGPLAPVLRRRRATAVLACGRWEKYPFDDLSALKSRNYCAEFKELLRHVFLRARKLLPGRSLLRLTKEKHLHSVDSWPRRLLEVCREEGLWTSILFACCVCEGWSGWTGHAWTCRGIRVERWSPLRPKWTRARISPENTCW